MSAIATIGVVGAGVMGAGIAAHAANAGAHVILLDAVPGAASRALAAMARAEPAPLMHQHNAKRITSGDLPADLALLGRCDWIIEAITEKPQAKRALYADIETVCRPGTIISSNTSTIPLAALVAGRGADFAAHFLITHFFNPPRYMRLLEVVAGAATRPEAVAAVRDFADRAMGKTVVECKDTPGFIANRIGSLWAAAAMRHAFDLGLTVEEADAAMGRPLGIPKTGIFGLMDLVGIDLGPHVAHSLLATLPAGDAYHALYREEPLVTRMIAEGRIGRKGRGGFYTMEGRGAQRRKMAIDLVTGAYRASAAARLDSIAEAKDDLRAFLAHPDRGGRYARAVLLDTLAYAAGLVPDIADSIADVDAAMRLGYNWQYGPFELLDRLGPAWFAAELRAAGRAVPALLARVGNGSFYRITDGRLEAFFPDGTYHPVLRPAGVLPLADIRRRGGRLAGNASASLWDLGDRVACLEFHSKMNALDPAVLDMIERCIALGGTGAFRALVIHNDARDFSVGANLGLALFAANIAAWNDVETMLARGQHALAALRAAPFPVVAAPAGMALGGGCEVVMHADAVVAHAETYLGLVEVGVGLIPAWGGCAALLSRLAATQGAKGGLPKGPMPPVMRAFEMISTAQVSKSAAEAQEMGFLRPADRIVMNLDRLLAEAKSTALAMVDSYAPPPPAPPLRLPGASGAAALAMAVDGFVKLGRASAHDALVAHHLAAALTGGAADAIEETPEEAVRMLERAGFMALLRNPATLARIEHTLNTGRPLRN